MEIPRQQFIHFIRCLGCWQMLRLAYLCVAESIVCEITKNCIMNLLERKLELAETLGRAIVERDMQNEQALFQSVDSGHIDHLLRGNLKFCKVP